MPSVNYPDMANVYLGEGIKHYINAAGYHTPVVSTGKIRTPQQAEIILREGRADLIGMARALLADPDLPRKAKEGREHQIIWCTYGNVCKNLDENFRKVTCVLWPKGSLQAPESSDRVAPVWPSQGAQLVAEYQKGQVFLNWNEAADNEFIYGYELFRSSYAGAFEHLASVKRTTHYDQAVAGGETYRYYVLAYDVAGNRTQPSNTVEVWADFPAGVSHHS